MYELIHMRDQGSCLFKAAAMGILKALQHAHPKNGPPRIHKRMVSVLSRELRQKVVDRMELRIQQNRRYMTTVAKAYMNRSDKKYDESKVSMPDMASKYLTRMRKKCTSAGPLETAQLNKVILSDYKQLFPKGLVVHTFPQQNDYTNYNYRYTIVLENMASTLVNNHKNVNHKQLHVIKSGDSHFDLLWHVADSPTKPRNLSIR